jgi:metal-responsive CopG/Arc/MetJ family transcriptional regulator
MEKVVTVKMDTKLVELIDLYAINNRKCRSEVIREAIIEYLSVRGFDLSG